MNDSRLRRTTNFEPGSRRNSATALAAALSAVLAVSGCTGAASVASEPCPTDNGKGCAPDSARVDLYTPTFSHPTDITNPLLPISLLDSVVYTGTVDGKPFRTETTLLPETRVVDVEGQHIETRVIQYMAFSDGRIEEIAVDLYAQDDKGAVWYLGEDVADYDETGEIYTHEGTWHAGVDGAPLTMNMPAVPRVSDAWRAENAAPDAWEQITVKSTGVTLDGPSGKVTGCVVSDELKLDNTGEQKVFAPGYGEISTGTLATDNLEALALAVPTDALSGGMPSELLQLSAATRTLFDAAEAGDWKGASTALDDLTSNWMSYRSTAAAPPLLEAEVERILPLLSAGVQAHEAIETRHAAIDLTRFVYDLRLRYQASIEINQVRFDLWLAQVQVDAAVGEPGPVKGDTATLELVWDRIKHGFESAASKRIDAQLRELRAAADAEDATMATTAASTLRETFSDVGWQ